MTSELDEMLQRGVTFDWRLAEKLIRDNKAMCAYVFDPQLGAKFCIWCDGRPAAPKPDCKFAGTTALLLDIGGSLWTCYIPQEERPEWTADTYWPKYVFVVAGQSASVDYTRHWDVRAFSTEVEAEGFAEKLNAWCKKNDCDAEPDSQLRRYAENEARGQKFHQAWWKEHGLSDITWDGDYMEDVYWGLDDNDKPRYRDSCERMSEAYAEHLRLELKESKQPLEDRDFCTSIAGTEYFVKEIPLHV